MAFERLTELWIGLRSGEGILRSGPVRLPTHRLRALIGALEELGREAAA